MNSHERLQLRLEDLTGKAKTRKELAEEYGVCTRTMRRWLKNEGFVSLGAEKIRPIDLEKIYLTFGLPKKVKSRWY